MASKIVTGDTPELMENILNNLNDETHSLYSCALVSQHWCRISIPILWQDPFSFDRKPLFISKYFSSLDENEKSILKEWEITEEFPNTLFDYAKFLKVLDLSRLENKVKKWIDLQNLDSKQHYDTLKYQVANLLFKLFIESGATLRKLDLYFSEFTIEMKPEIFYALERNDQFFSKLQDLSVGVVSEFSIENAITLLRNLAKNTTKINTLKIEEFQRYEPQLCHEFVHIIRSQEQLRKFKLIGGNEFPAEFHGTISALESQKKSLHEIEIDRCDYSAEFEVLMKCENLEIFRVMCFEEEKRLLKLLDTSFYKISTLEIVNYPIDVSNISFFLAKYGSLLQRLKLDSGDLELFRPQPTLLETVKSFCPNITYLNLSHIEFSTRLLELIESLQKLEFLTLWCILDIKDDDTEDEDEDYMPDDMQDERIETKVWKFTEILPSTLQYLDIRKAGLDSYIDIILKNCDVPLKKLLINRIYDEDEVSQLWDRLMPNVHVRTLLKFCQRTSTLNYVGVDLSDDDFRKQFERYEKRLEGYVKLVPYERIIVNC